MGLLDRIKAANAAKAKTAPCAPMPEPVPVEVVKYNPPVGGLAGVAERPIWKRDGRNVMRIIGWEPVE